MSYTPIEEYGVLGNLESCPLVGGDGSIDWWCAPHLESGSIFAAMLDDDRGGRFAVRPAGAFDSTQAYVEETNVLETTFHTGDGTMTLTDFMPLPPEPLFGTAENAIYRRARCAEGSIECDVTFEPRFDYGRVETSVGETNTGVIARGNGEHVSLWSPVDFAIREDTRADASTTLDAGETVWFALQYNDREPMSAPKCEQALEETVDRWSTWCAHCGEDHDCRFAGSYHDTVVRSSLVLRLLMNPTTHAIAAAPTTSLPETVGGVRNWDYRYAWIRDVAFTIQALYEFGHEVEARKGFDWCLSMCVKDDPGEIAHPFYGLHHRTSAREETIDGLSGYRDSSPVRVGNRAGQQVQLDTYGELITAIYTATNYGEEMSTAEWSVIRDVIDYVCEVWTNRDHGIWEFRQEPSHTVHSKVLCWAAVDRGVKMAESGGFEAPLERWKDERAAIHEEVLERGYDESLGSFTQTYGGSAVDAATLQIGLVGFLPFDDERIQGTIDTVMDRLQTEEGLVNRYVNDDGLPGDDHPFVLCTCWLVDCLALSGRVEEAREVFDRLTTHEGDLGLYAEEIEPETGEHRGNYPQAFSHVGLVNSVLYLNKAEAGETVEPVGIEPSERYQT